MDDFWGTPILGNLPHIYIYKHIIYENTGMS